MNFYKSFVIKPFQIYSPHFNIYFLWKYNRDSVDFKETPPSKILLGRCVELGVFFTGETSFSSRFFFDNLEIYAQIQKPTKCLSTPQVERNWIIITRKWIDVPVFSPVAKQLMT